MINLPTVLIALLIFAAFAAVVVNGIRRRRRGGGCGCGCSGCSGCGVPQRARTPEPHGRKPS